MTPDERKKFEDVRSPHLKYWIPLVWFSNLASKARQEGRIEDSVDLQNLLHVSAPGPGLGYSSRWRKQAGKDTEGRSSPAPSCPPATQLFPSDQQLSVAPGYRVNRITRLAGYQAD